MRFICLFCLSFFLLSAKVFAQNNYSVKGVVADSVEHAKLGNASVTVLEAKDSILVKFTRAAENGTFSLSGLSKGKYIVLVAYPDYADYVESFSLDSAHALHSFGHINMSLKSRLLKEVIIKGTISQMKIKGDTTEFNARAYVLQPNAKVEDLLKQLPGIQVDKDGKITAQGQQVAHVLVDGEEFFGDDPTLVTKNIRADMVDKVQVYDKKSDQATFTGIDDGQKEKTINIKLKADKKNGMFGRAEAGDGTEGIYQSQLLFNMFKNKEKFSVYGTMGNNGKVGLGWEDNQKYGSGSNLQFGDSGEVFISFGANDDLDSFSGMYNGQGLPLARNGGVHYDGKWDDDKQSINTNYKIGSLNVDGTQNNLTQNNLPGNILNSSSDQVFHNYMFRQKLDATYQVKLDTASNLKIAFDGTEKHSTTSSDYTANELRNDTLVNNSTRNLTNTVDQKIFNASALYTHKFKKTGRTFSFSITEAYNQSQANGYLKSTINYYNAQAQVDSSQNIDEYKTNNLKSNALNTNITYSEPFSKYFAVVVNYGFGISNSNADRQTFNPTAPGVYNSLDSALSSNYKLDQIINAGGAIFNYKRGKTIVNFGTRVNDVSFHQVDEFTGNPQDRNFVNWAPQANFQYRFSQQKSFNIGYRGYTTQPTLDQIQPIPINNDPLNIVLGNPELTPSFTNNFNVNYNSYKVITGQYIWLYANYSFTTNPIMNDITYDPLSGKSTSQYFNRPGKQNSNFFIGANFDRKFEKADFSAGFGLNANGNVYYNLVNDEVNMTKSYTFNPRINFSKYKEKKIEFYLNAGPTYTISESSLQPLANNNGWGAQGDSHIAIFLPWKFQIGTDDNYQYSAPTQSFNTSFSKLLINAFLIKTFLKQDNLKFTLWGNDLLNQDIGFRRSANANLITQNSYTTLRRYVMFTIDYEFTKMGGAQAKK
ncbi:MAG TPA: TonB-dependent receptor [Mucilaginibacter sp.]|nr:TonB-dependent receptor [Mucilaginibacter sp.]